MINRLVARKVPANAGAAIVAHDPRRLVDLRLQNRSQSMRADTRNVMRPNIPAALNEGEYDLFADAARTGVLAFAAVFILFSTTDISLVDLDRLTIAAERPIRM